MEYDALNKENEWVSFFLRNAIGNSVKFVHINENFQGGSVKEDKNLVENNLILRIYLFCLPSNLFDKEYCHQEQQIIIAGPTDCEARV